MSLLATAAMLLAAHTSAWSAGDLDDSVEAPDFALKSIAGPNYRLSEYRSEVVALTFWASWCGECRTQLQDFRELHDLYASVGFEVLAVSLDTEMSRVRETAESLDLDFPVLHDPSGDVGELYSADELPLVVLIDREGRVRGSIEGYQHSTHDEYASRIRALLRE